MADRRLYLPKHGSLLVLLATILLTPSCTNTTTQDSVLITPTKPVLRQASIEDREAAMKRLAVDLDAQNQALKKSDVAVANRREIDYAKLKPASRDTQLALLSPQTGELPLNLAADETVASVPSVEPVANTGGPLGRFHAKLTAISSGKRNKPVTILHIGDSHVASDSFSRGIRTELQARYGDAGRGMVIPASAFEYGIADQVKLSANGNWRSRTALKHRKGSFGLSGVSVSSRSSRSSMSLTSRTGAFDWVEATIVTGPSQGAFFLQVGSRKQRFDAWSKVAGSKNFRIDARGTRATLSPGGGAQTTVLSWSTGKDKPGIRYVNFGLIGATVHVSKRLNPKLVANDVRRLDPDLIIYGYGTNEGFDDRLDLSAYIKRASAYVNELKTSAPNADIIYLGAASGLRRGGNKACGRWSTPPKLDPLRKRVAKLAASQNSAYWDWSQAMGGPCAINVWASKGLAAKDRVHLSPKGYAKSATIFANWLMQPTNSNVAVVLN